MKYIILEEPTPTELQRKVNEALQSGYILQGGVCVGPSKLWDGICYVQALIYDSDSLPALRAETPSR